MAGIRFKDLSLETDMLRARLSMARPSRRAERAFRALHRRVGEDMLPYMPSRTGGFRQRTQAANRALIGSGQVLAGVGPMGRYLYQNRVMVDAATGRGPQMIPGVGPRFEKGADLTATDRQLRYSYAGTRPFWFAYAKQRRMDSWTEEVQRILDGK